MIFLQESWCPGARASCHILRQLGTEITNAKGNLDFFLSKCL